MILTLKENNEYCKKCQDFGICPDIDYDTVVYDCDYRKLSFDVDCGYKNCRAVTKRVDQDFCRGHKKTFEERFNKKYWVCIIGPVDPDELSSDGSDSPMRTAIRDKFSDIIGRYAKDCWSGWGCTESQKNGILKVWSKK